MTYLINSELGLKEVETYEEVLSTLRKITALWCADEDYEGDDFETLFQECLEEQDFEDIAQVYQAYTHFTASNGQVFFCSLSTADKNTEFKLVRIL